MWLSVLPGSNLAISDHLFPSFLWASMIRKSSSSDHLFFLISGFKWLCHLQHSVIGHYSLPLSALLADPTRKSSGYLAPVLWTKLAYHFNQNLIFLLRPGSLDHSWVQNLLPPVQTLHVSPVLEEWCYPLPVLGLNLIRNKLLWLTPYCSTRVLNFSS